MREVLGIAPGIPGGLAETADARSDRYEREGRRALSRRTMFLMISAAMVALAAAVATLPKSQATTDVWGTVPAWVSAVGGSLAFLLTFMLFLQGRRDRIREQANAVYVTEEVTERGDGSLLVKACVHNGSDAPIWYVQVYPQHTGGGSFGRDLDKPEEDIQPKDHQCLWEWEIPREEIKFRGRSPRLVFTDAADRRWERTGVRVSRLHLFRRIIRRHQELP